MVFGPQFAAPDKNGAQPLSFAGEEPRKGSLESKRHRDHVHDTVIELLASDRIGSATRTLDSVLFLGWDSGCWHSGWPTERFHSSSTGRQSFRANRVQILERVEPKNLTRYGWPACQLNHKTGKPKQSTLYKQKRRRFDRAVIVAPLLADREFSEM